MQGFFNVAEKNKPRALSENVQYINEFHKPDCPQIQSSPSPLSGHQLPEINMQILISNLLFYCM